MCTWQNGKLGGLVRSRTVGDANHALVKRGGGSEVRHRPEVNPPLSPTVDGLLGNEDDAIYQLKIIHMKLIDCPSESLAPSLTREAVFGPQTRVHPVSVPAETG